MLSHSIRVRAARPDDAATIAQLVAATKDTVTASLGVAGWIGGETGKDVVDRADRALYQAKDAGRDRVVVVEHEGR